MAHQAGREPGSDIGADPDRSHLGPVFSIAVPLASGTETGTRALTFRISNVDGEDIDLAAWSPRFGELATWYGRGFALGQDQIDNPAAYFDVGALRIHRTPLDWLKANRDGICIIQPNLTYATLRSVLERSFYLWHERYRLKKNRMTGAGEALPKLHRPYIVSALFS